MRSNNVTETSAKKKNRLVRKTTSVYGSALKPKNKGAIPEMHTCILRVTEQGGYDFTKKKGKFDPKIDNNFYRKVSKYDLDSMSVDWTKLMREKNR